MPNHRILGLYVPCVECRCCINWGASSSSIARENIFFEFVASFRRFGVCWGFGFFSDEQFPFFGCWVVESGCGVHHATTYRMHPMCHFGIQFNYNFLFKYIREWNVKLHKLYVFRLEIKLNWRKTRGEVSRCAVEIQVELGRSVGVCETRHTHANSWTEADIFHTRQMTSRRAEEKTQFTQIHVINERR